MGIRTRNRGRRARGVAVVAVATGLVAASGCSDPVYDTDTPGAALDAMRSMIAVGRADLLPTMVHVDVRDVTFDDGVTEASAVEDVRAKTGDMLGQLWRVSTKLRDRFPDEVEDE